MDIWQTKKSGQNKHTSIPDQHQAFQSQDRMRRIFQLESRKKQMEREREDAISKENKHLFMKMTSILQDGAGHVMPKRQKNLGRINSPHNSALSPVNSG